MDVIGYTENGEIRAIFDGVEFIVPDTMENRHRYMIWDEWEMGPPDPETGERTRINTIPPYVPPPEPPYVLPIGTLWSRMNSDIGEDEDFDTAMSTATPLRLRKQFNLASTLTQGTELFNFVKTVLETVVSATRAAELMAKPAVGEASKSIEEAAAE